MIPLVFILSRFSSLIQPTFIYQGHCWQFALCYLLLRVRMTWSNHISVSDIEFLSISRYFGEILCFRIESTFSASFSFNCFPQNVLPNMSITPKIQQVLFCVLLVSVYQSANIHSFLWCAKRNFPFFRGLNDKSHRAAAVVATIVAIYCQIWSKKFMPEQKQKKQKKIMRNKSQLMRRPRTNFYII